MKLHIQSLFIGFVAGVATAAVVPVLAPALSEGARPLAKALLKHGLLGIERLRGAVARTSESVEDLVAEVRAEVESQLSAAAARRVKSSTESTKVAKSAPPRPNAPMVS